jgi:uncharacterized protein
MTWLQTYSNKKFSYTNPTVDMIDIEDIAHGLSLQCRFAGQCRRFYSVAEHSVHVATLMDHNKLSGLLHDAAEAYLTDLPTPLKLLVPGYGRIEKMTERAIEQRFGIDLQGSDVVRQIKLADAVMLKIEAQNLLTGPMIDNWTDTLPDTHIAIRINGWSPMVAREMFTRIFTELDLSKAA